MPAKFQIKNCPQEGVIGGFVDFVLPDLCDEYPDLVRVVAPIFTNYGGR